MNNLDTAWTQVVIQLGSFGVLAVFVVGYLPRMFQKAISYVDGMGTAFREDLRTVATTFKTEVEEVRARSDKRADKIVDTLASMEKSSREQMARVEAKMDSLALLMQEVLRKLNNKGKRDDDKVSP